MLLHLSSAPRPLSRPLGSRSRRPSPHCCRIVARAPSAAAPGAEFKPCDVGLPSRIKVVGMGSCGVDYLASVAAYPQPDEKLRTQMLEVQGGGNCANALTAAARLGLSPTIVTKIGGDGLGDGIISELTADGVDTSLILRAAGHPSPFTYIIVDRSGGTRTCIHTPGAPMVPEELPPGLVDSTLEGAALVYFDGRLAEAAVLLAARARQVGIPVLVEAERLRPGLDDLLALADYVVTSAHFPQEWTGEKELSDALLVMAQRLPAARFLITTLGRRGSCMLCRAEGPEGEEQGQGQQGSRSLKDVLSELEEELQQSSSEAGTSVDCISRTGVHIRAGPVVSSRGVLPLLLSADHDAAEAQAQAAAAAVRAAAMNADPGRAAEYSGSGQGQQQQRQAPLSARVLRAAAAVLPGGAVVDTTGAGDSFMGSVLYGITTGLGPVKTLQLGSVVAACKCTEVGARPGLPHRSNLTASLLHEVASK